jgi:ABC-type oligopeptide transport system ATPase subunit
MAAKIKKTTGPKVCRPFTLDVMVMNPSADFKFTLSVELACSAQADQIWKLVFDLFKKVNNDFVQVVHVSFTAQTPVEVAGIQATGKNGVNQKQADVVVNQIHPKVVEISNAPAPDPAASQAVSGETCHAVSSSTRADRGRDSRRRVHHAGANCGQELRRQPDRR